MLRVEWEFERKGNGMGKKWWETNLLRKLRKEGEKRMGKIMAIFDTIGQLDLHCWLILKIILF